MSDVAKEIETIIRNQLNNFSEMNFNAPLESLGIDDLDFVEIALTIEDKYLKYDLTLNIDCNAAVDESSTMYDVIRYVENLIIKQLQTTVELAPDKYRDKYAFDWFEDSEDFTDFMGLTVAGVDSTYILRIEDKQAAINALEEIIRAS